MASLTYVIYDESTGEVLGKESGPIGALVEPEGAFLEIEGPFSGKVNDIYVVDGLVKHKPAKPSERHVFDIPSESWVISLEDEKASCWDRIKRDRNGEEFGTFVWNDHTFDCDEVSQRRIQGAVQLAALDTSVVMDWTLADNTAQTFNATELQQIGQALGAHVNACHVKARGLRDQINAAESEAELSVISW